MILMNVSETIAITENLRFGMPYRLCTSDYQGHHTLSRRTYPLDCIGVTSGKDNRDTLHALED